MFHFQMSVTDFCNEGSVGSSRYFFIVCVTLAVFSPFVALSFLCLSPLFRSSWSVFRLFLLPPYSTSSESSNWLVFSHFRFDFRSNLPSKLPDSIPLRCLTSHLSSAYWLCDISFKRQSALFIYHTEFSFSGTETHIQTEGKSHNCSLPVSFHV